MEEEVPKLIGLAKYIQDQVENKPAGRRMAKKILVRGIKRSPLLTEKDKDVCKEELESIAKKDREYFKDKIQSDKVIYKKIADLHPAKELRRTYISLRDYERLRDDIKRRGVIVPLFIKSDGSIICGRHRWQAAKELRILDVPCIILKDDLEKKELAILYFTDNLCRRQMIEVEQISMIRQLMELYDSGRKASPGRPRKGEERPLSKRKVAKMLHVSPTRAQELLGKAHDLYEEIKESHSFAMTVGKSIYKDRDFLPDIYKWVGGTYENLKLQSGDYVKVSIMVEARKKEDENIEEQPSS